MNEMRKQYHKELNQRANIEQAMEQKRRNDRMARVYDKLERT